MEPFTTLCGIAAPLDEPNVDTNQLCPTRFNKVSRGPDHARILFHDRRFGPDGSEKAFVLNSQPYRRAKILIADRNFGGGSARETAVWALYEFGIRCVIATSFGDVFAKMSYKEGLLPVVLPQNDVSAMRRQAHEQPEATVSIDLATQTVTDIAGNVHEFEIYPVYKKCLLEGLDDIARIHQYRDRLDAFEMSYRTQRPWLYTKRG